MKRRLTSVDDQDHACVQMIPEEDRTPGNANTNRGGREAVFDAAVKEIQMLQQGF